MAFFNREKQPITPPLRVTARYVEADEAYRQASKTGDKATINQRKKELVDARREFEIAKRDKKT